MQIHELNKRNVLEQRPPKPAPVTGLDTSKVSPYIAAQIKKAEADSQANLTQQAQAPAQPAPVQPTRSQNIPINPNVKPGGSKEAQAFQAQQAAQQAALQAAQQAAQQATKPTWRDNIKGRAIAVKNAAVDSTRGKWDPAYAYGDPGRPAAAQPATPAPDMSAELAKLGISDRQVAGIGKILQQTNNQNTRLTRTGDPAVDKFLQAMGYNVR